MKFVPDIELQSIDRIQSYQEEKLKELLIYLSTHSPFYKKHFREHKIDIQSIVNLHDLEKIPAITKDHFQEHNWDFLCVDKTKVVEYTSTSGTMGKPVVVALTENDLQRLAYNECISFACADGTPDDLYQLMVTLDRQFMAGIAYYDGIRKLGGGIVRVGPGLPAMQLETIERLKPTVLVAVPSFIVKLIEFANVNGIDLNKSSVKKAICIGESLRSADLQPSTLTKKIQELWNIKLYGTYASTEMQTAFTECVEGQGGHHHPELIIVEVLDDQEKAVKPGEPGEVTITTLGVEGMPLLRYKTGDIAAYYNEPCKCGRHTLRLGPIIGRKQQMIKLKGTTLYPTGVFDIIHQIHHVKDYVVEVFSNELGTDELKLHLLTEEADKEAVETQINNAFQSRLRVKPYIHFATHSEIEKIQLNGMSRKLKKFIDNRKY
ncbi:MAG TPA: AMP-binding protein [Cyclobacteriaceae bacterium]|nr:AMP-binding protein [Cyclobacteriaceae bacterium]